MLIKDRHLQNWEIKDRLVYTASKFQWQQSQPLTEKLLDQLLLVKYQPTSEQLVIGVKPNGETDWLQESPCLSIKMCPVIQTQTGQRHFHSISTVIRWPFFVEDHLLYMYMVTPADSSLKTGWSKKDNSRKPNKVRLILCTNYFVKCNIYR